MSKKKIAIIGGGAAGFFCAANLNPDLYDITILEQSAEVLQKVKISGGGRCNVTNACFDPKELVQFYPRGNKALLSVFNQFQPGDTFAWFEERSVKLKIEDDQRVFPESNSSQTIIDLLLSESKKRNVFIKTKTSVQEIQKNGEGYQIHTNAGNILTDYIIYTTGSSPKSYKILQKLGHQIVNPVPSLFTFMIEDELIGSLPGTSFSNATVEIPTLNREEYGSLLITHWGLSGPAILRLSAWEAKALAQKNYLFEIKVNFISLSIEQALEIFKEYKMNHPKRTLESSKVFDVTNRFWREILKISKVSPHLQMANLSSKEMNTILGHLCQKTFLVKGKATHKEEFVTAGGVDLKEVNFKMMSSKLLSHFYLAGEVLNIDGVTGGFNFQACWSEAWIIANHLNLQLD